MSERGMSQIMTQRNGLCQTFVETQGPGNGPGNLRHLQRMGQSGPVMIPLGRQEYLSLVLQSAERFAVEDPIPVSLIFRTDIAQLLLSFPPPGISAQSSIWA